MKIAMLGHKRVPSREGGVEVVVTELAARMAALGHDVAVYNRGGRGSSPSADRPEAGSACAYRGVKIESVKTIDAKGLAAASSSYFAMKAAIQAKPDIIHVHAEGPAAVCGMARRAGIPCVVTVHGLDWQRAKWGALGRRYILLGEKEAVKNADGMIVLSRSVKDYFQKKYGRVTRFIPNGIAAKARIAPRVIRDGYGLEGGDYVLYVGRMVPEKGVHYLIEAYRSLRERGLHRGRKLVLAGGPSDSREYYDRLRAMAASNPDILFTGFVEGDELAELYSNAYLYVLPSDLEGMPMSLLEGMAYGNCCVVSDIPENASVVGSCGVTFERGSVASLASRLEGLLADQSQVERYASQAADHVIGAYDWDRVCEQTLSLYEECISERGCLCPNRN